MVAMVTTVVQICPHATGTQRNLCCIHKSIVKHKKTNLIENWTSITLLSHVGRFHDLGICQFYFVGLSNKVGLFIYHSYIQADLEIWVELYS